MSKAKTETVFSVGTLVRFDGYKDFVGRVVAIHITAGDVISYDVEWDSDDKGNYQQHTFTADRVELFSLDNHVPMQIGFGGSLGN